MTVAVGAHYFLLATFFWMLSEGIMLYILLVKVFGNATKKWYWLLVIGWGESKSKCTVYSVADLAPTPG